MDNSREAQTSKHNDVWTAWPNNFLPLLLECKKSANDEFAPQGKHNATTEHSPQKATFEDTVRLLTTEAEQGQSTSSELNRMTIPERVKIAKAMDVLNAADRKNNSSLPDLEIDLGREITKFEVSNRLDEHKGPEHLLNISRVENPNAPLPILRGESQVYAMPGEAAKDYEWSKRFPGQFSSSDFAYQKALKEDTDLSKKMSVTNPV